MDRILEALGQIGSFLCGVGATALVVIEIRRSRKPRKPKGKP